MKKPNFEINPSHVSSFPGSVMFGDIEGDAVEVGDVTIGDVEVGDIDGDFEGDTDGDVDGDLEGAVRRARRNVARKTKVNFSINSSAKGPAVQMAQNAVKAAKDTFMGMPGAALNSALMPPIIVANAKMVSPGTLQRIQGWLLVHNIQRMLSECTWSTKVTSATSSGSSTTITIGGQSPPSGTKWVIPIFFLTITSSMLQSQSGSRISISWTGVDVNNVALTSDTWILERSKLTRSVQLSIVPYFRIKDMIKPVLVNLFQFIPALSLSDTPVSSGIYTSFVVTIDGLVSGEIAQLVTPGLDSAELKQFLSAWKLKLI